MGREETREPLRSARRRQVRLIKSLITSRGPSAGKRWPTLRRVAARLRCSPTATLWDRKDCLAAIARNNRSIFSSGNSIMRFCPYRFLFPF